MGNTVNMHAITDLHALVEAGVGGDDRAFSMLFDRYRLYAWGVALRVTSNRSNAEEAVIDGFASAFRSLGRLRDPLHFPGYLASCVRNEALMSARSKRDTVQIDTMQEPVSAEVTPEDAHDLINGDSEAMEAYHRLDDRQQRAVFLIYIEGVSAIEAATSLGLTVNAFHQLLFRARRNLRLRYIAPALATDAPRECQACTNKLAAYVGGKATARTVTMVEDHIFGCHECDQRLTESRVTNDLLVQATGRLPEALIAAPIIDRPIIPQQTATMVRNMGLAALAVAAVTSMSLLPRQGTPLRQESRGTGASKSMRGSTASHIAGASASEAKASEAALSASWLVMSVSSGSADLRCPHVPRILPMTYSTSYVRPVDSGSAESVVTDEYTNDEDPRSPSVSYCAFHAHKDQELPYGSTLDAAHIRWPGQSLAAA
jgi:RNA polymerase sigma-70 factor (ECF subfamily)